MGRPVTTGESPHVTFRAKAPLGDILNKRRASPTCATTRLPRR